jgi:multicomponent Na+:H+ antiporter subunit B
MSIIVKNTARMITAFVVIFGVYIAITGHLSPGGGFSGGVILAAGAVLVVLAFGGGFSSGIFTDRGCHAWDGVGALGFLVVALMGYVAGAFFVNFIPLGEVGKLYSGGAIPISNLAILLKVAAGLTGGFLALAGFRTAAGGESDTTIGEV